MNFEARIKRFIFRKVVKAKVRKLNSLEKSLVDQKNVITANENGPIRFDIPMNLVNLAENYKPNNLMNRLTILPLISNVKNIKKSYNSLKKNGENIDLTADDNFIQNLKEFCEIQAVSSVGFTKLPHNLIFKDKGILFENAIVLTMEMDKNLIARAPHLKTGGMIMQTYDKLGIAANKLATFLRDHGYSAQSSHPLGGVLVYPPLAIQAGLGWNGRHGLLITPECGPRVRIAAVFTNISNLPNEIENQHSWISKYCASCGRCIKECPPKSLYETPIIRENGLISHNDTEKCFPYFASHHGCTICIKVCPFSTIGYEKIFEKTSNRKKIT